MREIHYHDFESGDYHKILTSSTARKLLEHVSEDPFNHEGDWQGFLTCRVNFLIEESKGSDLEEDLFLIGCAALSAFLQSNVTGPPLSWNPATIIIPQKVRDWLAPEIEIQVRLIASLTVDGEAVYKLTPHVELFCLAKSLLNFEFADHGAATEHLRYRLRVNFWHQRLLSDTSPSLQESIYRDLQLLEEKLLGEVRQARAEFLIERATIHNYYGYDAKARDDLAEAARLRRFEFALTGRLGKRTKFQQKELSQLVVLAKSAEKDQTNSTNSDDHSEQQADRVEMHKSDDLAKPVELQLNDDTLLESISFSEDSPDLSVQDEQSIPMALKDLDPADQPALDPLDSIILLATASSITNTSPQDGLTREETLPYATRVLAGGSTNWQIYTQALIVRSRIEGYKSRTTERGLLQLQAVVDQVIAETTSEAGHQPQETAQEQSQTSATTFLPQLKSSESAPVSERLQYVHLLASPTRWKLESELADRWVSLGGLRTALEIYERLQMWAEVGLCWAAQDREDKAKQIIRQQLYVSESNDASEERVDVNGDVVSSTEGATERDPLPNDAPRLFCILGDIEKSVTAYERAWEISNCRYARAQRSLGKHYFAIKELKKADEAYTKSLKLNPQNHGIWFALGCVRLQLEDWTGAAEAFARAVQIEDKDAESWSNLAAALLRLAPEQTTAPTKDISEEEETEDLSPETPKPDPQTHIREAFAALKRAASLKRDSYRIWQNLLHVSVQLSPPPYTDIIIAQTRLIDLLSKTQGRKASTSPSTSSARRRGEKHRHPHRRRPRRAPHRHLPFPSFPLTNQKAEANNPQHPDTPNKTPGFEKMLLTLLLKRIPPLITTSRRLWLLLAKLHLHFQHPSAALSAYEKAWRVTLNQPGWEESEELWKDVVEATTDLVDAYQSLGERKREGGMGRGNWWRGIEI
ncbi:TPR repeat-containing protein C19B12.01 [Physcia stellaris]|nr:TPR repeat-containing protein C19B12.01 [Physcia stellaris]